MIERHLEFGCCHRSILEVPTSYSGIHTPRMHVWTASRMAPPAEHRNWRARRGPTVGCLRDKHSVASGVEATRDSQLDSTFEFWIPVTCTPRG